MTRDLHITVTLVIKEMSCTMSNINLIRLACWNQRIDTTTARHFSSFNFVLITKQKKENGRWYFDGLFRIVSSFV